MVNRTPVRFNYTRILKECFWDLNVSEEDLKKIPLGQDERLKSMVIEKVLLNSTFFLKDLQLFSLKDLEVFLQTYNIPKFNYEFVFRRKNMAESFFFGKPLLVEELKWRC